MTRFLLAPLLMGLLDGGCVRISEYSPLVTGSAPSGTAWAQPTPVPSPSFPIRVAISVRRPSVHLVAPENFVMSGFPLDGTPVVAKGQKLYHEATLKSGQLYSRRAYIEPLGDGEIRVDGRTYRGSIEILEEPKGALTVINELPLEEYVCGVLAGEVPRDWPEAALEAQAVAARTFAVLNREQARRKGEPYDLENTALFQMYQGSGLVNDKIRRAVQATRGDVMTYKSSLVMAFFHSNCGGRTSGSLEVWSKDYPYLQPVDCEFGNNGPHFHWKAEVPCRDLVRKLRAAGLDLGDVVRIEALDRDEGNRILRLAIMDEQGRNRVMKASAFRMAVGPDVIRSTRFTAEISGDKAVFTGRGWGHGVGLCQEGAFGMALKGYNGFEILRHYYKGILVEKLKDQF